jgi:Rap1a immunity proteins
VVTVKNHGGLAALALCIAASAGSARAAVTEDNFLLHNNADLVAMCSAEKSDPMYTAATNFCHGFAVGVFRVLQEEEMAARPSARLFCLPDPAPSRNESMANFVQWATADSKRLGQPPADGIAAFLAQQFPCPRKR